MDQSELHYKVIPSTDGSGKFDIVRLGDSKIVAQCDDLWMSADIVKALETVKRLKEINQLGF